MIRTITQDVTIRRVTGFRKIRNETLAPSSKPAPVVDRQTQELALQIWEMATDFGADETLLGKAAVMSHEHGKNGHAHQTSTSIVVDQLIQAGRMKLRQAASVLSVNVPTLHLYLEGQTIPPNLESSRQPSFKIIDAVPIRSQGERLAQDFQIAWVLDSLRRAYGHDSHFDPAMELIKETFFRRERAESKYPNITFTPTLSSSNSVSSNVTDETNRPESLEEAFERGDWPTFIARLDKSGSVPEYRLASKRLSPSNLTVFHAISSANGSMEHRQAAARLYGLFGKNNYFPEALQVILWDRWGLENYVQKLLVALLESYQRTTLDNLTPLRAPLGVTDLSSKVRRDKEKKGINTLEKRESRIAKLLGERWEHQSKMTISPSVLSRVLRVLAECLKPDEEDDFSTPFLIVNLVDALNVKFPDRSGFKPVAEIALSATKRDETALIVSEILCHMIWKRMAAEGIRGANIKDYLGFDPPQYIIESLEGQ